MVNRLSAWLNENGFGVVVREEPLGGGCINNVTRLCLDSGRSVVLKYQQNPPDDLYIAETAGLKALAAAGTLRVPTVIHQESDCLLLEDLGQGTPAAGFHERLGSGLAGIHAGAQAEFGFLIDTYCGATPQDNTPDADGHDFFANRRLRPLGRLCRDRGLLGSAESDRLETVCERLGDWIPRQRPVLIHGDLWSGNIHCDEKGQPALIDPAVYHGWAEAELAMTTLFGRLDTRFYHAYLELAQVDPDWEERAPLYNLYHLLNHLHLFGRSYLAPVQRILGRYAGD
ncbi:MAG: fructosamine kinase family protein [Pseudohongiellaceae bacterium]